MRARSLTSARLATPGSGIDGVTGVADVVHIRVRGLSIDPEVMSSGSRGDREYGRARGEGPGDDLRRDQHPVVRPRAASRRQEDVLRPP